MLKLKMRLLVLIMFFSITTLPVLAQETKTDIDIDSFIMQKHEMGVPCDQARSFKSEVVPKLSEMLNDAEYEPYWENIVVTLGCIGDPSAVPVLKEFVDEHQGNISFDTFAALQGVPTAIGFISEKGDGEALEFLTQLSDTDYWEEVRYKVFDNSAINDSIVKKSLFRSTIIALGYSGQEEALSKLQDLKNDPAINQDFETDIDFAISQ